MMVYRVPFNDLCFGKILDWNFFEQRSTIRFFTIKISIHQKKSIMCQEKRITWTKNLFYVWATQNGCWCDFYFFWLNEFLVFIWTKSNHISIFFENQSMIVCSWNLFYWIIFQKKCWCFSVLWIRKSKSLFKSLK